MSIAISEELGDLTASVLTTICNLETQAPDQLKLTLLQMIWERRPLWGTLLVVFLGLCLKSSIKRAKCYSKSGATESYYLSWRVGVETNNIRGWSVPIKCLCHVKYYMLEGQYESDIEMIMEQIHTLIDSIVATSPSAMNAWILDVDDTCISNLPYYRGKRFGCDPYDPLGFKTWAMRGECPAIPAVLRLFNKLVDSGFKIFLLTGRDDETLRQPTTKNLHNQGFAGYERLIMRSREYKGQSATSFKSDVRRQLVEQGYRICANVGDQWSDLAGDYVGERTFKIPNPMYFVP